MRAFSGILILSFFVLLGCQKLTPSIHIPQNFSIGELKHFKVEGLEPLESYSIKSKKVDALGRYWVSESVFKSNEAGVIDLRHNIPENGSYQNADIYGSLWSMSMPNPPGKDWKAPSPNDFEDLQFFVVKETDTLTEIKVKQWITPESVSKEEIHGSLEANIFFPKEIEGKKPGVLIIGGSGGGLSWASRMGALLADQGFVCMALAYFNAGDLPQHLAQLPLEYVNNAIDYLYHLDKVDSLKIGILGYSKGAELGLLMASRNSSIRAIAAIAPGSAVFQGFKPPKYPVRSSWSFEDQDLDFVPNAYDKKFFETFDGMYLWYRTLAQPDKMESASIPVEKINGPILLLSGIKDQIWPSTYMGEQIVARLHMSEFPYSFDHQAFPDAGHGIAEPPGYPTIQLSERLGGTPEGNHQARKKVWKELKLFFEEAFDGY